MNTLMTNWLAGLLVLVLAVPAVGDSASAGQDKEMQSSTELSVAPLDHVTYPQSRPDWVAEADSAAPFTALDDSRVVVLSGLCDTRRQAEDRLNVAARVAVDQYVIERGDFFRKDDLLKFSDQEIEQLITRRYLGTAEQGEMTMHEGAAELTFNPAVQRRIVETACNAEVGRRLGHIGGLLSGAIVALLGSTVVVSALSKRRRRRASERV